MSSENGVPAERVVKPRYKIWNWYIERHDVLMSMNPTGTKKYWYSLNGISDQYMQGRLDISTSKIIRLDFELGIVETMNSIYELQSEPKA